ncbi:imidazoleglycerol-phosphate dehydratase [Ignicoccus pacificus DSM 13166]|uniref:Imidazoleglycerol-phosphate dehydratase n=1 Tax=Ignicoccus pacificus DSM 13166 TaxID=940294 RepID=A0A977PKH9_9CREN|nr:imidazoleglycerol-phosphate dehydratase [Ignicoccus pacificus DSM 13166]
MKRVTRETSIEVEKCDTTQVVTPIPFFTHMLETLLKHSSLSLCINAEDLLGYDDHHVVEDVAIVLGRYLNTLFKKDLKRRFAWSVVPMDESLALCSLDVSGRGSFHYDFSFEREEIGGLATENVAHFFETIAREARITLHLRILSGTNDHHKIEALFKSFAICLGQSLGTWRGGGSTKGVLDL